MTATFTVTAEARAILRRDASESHLGRTVLWTEGYPLGADHDHIVIEGEDALEQRIRHRLITRRGSWKSRPDYGADIEDLLNRLEHAGTMDEVERRVRDQLSYEAEVARVLEVGTRVEENDDGVTLWVTVVYESIAAAQREVEVSYRRAG